MFPVHIIALELLRETTFIFFRARIWSLASAREDLIDILALRYRSFLLCGAHFENHMLLNDFKNRLQPNAVPTIFPSLEGPSSHLRDHTYCFFNYSDSVISSVPTHNRGTIHNLKIGAVQC